MGIAAIFQALSCFLTQNDLERIQKEIVHRFGNNVNDGSNVKINLNQFVELFINHRSTFEISLDALHQSFMNIIEKEDNEQMTISRDRFLEIMQRRGDKIQRDELMHCLQALTGYNRKQLKHLLPDRIDAAFFTQYILGLKPQKQ